MIAIRSNRSLWTCWNVSHVDVQLAIEKIAVISAKTIDQIQLILLFLKEKYTAISIINLTLTCSTPKKFLKLS